MVNDERTIPQDYLARLEDRPAITRADYDAVKRRLADLRLERDVYLAERDTQAFLLNRRLGRLEQALRMCRDCHSVKQVRTIVRTALADGGTAPAAPAVESGTEGQP